MRNPQIPQDGAPTCGGAVESRPALITRPCVRCEGRGHYLQYGEDRRGYDVRSVTCPACKGTKVETFEAHPVIDGEVS